MQQLQEFINKCIDKGFEYKFLQRHRHEQLKFTSSNIFNNEELIEEWEYISYHELFSVQSGLMEFVKRKRPNNKKYILVNGDDVYDLEPEVYHLFEMSTETAEKKIQYFLENALLP